jgi:hypothetical protein
MRAHELAELPESLGEALENPFVGVPELERRETSDFSRRYFGTDAPIAVVDQLITATLRIRNRRSELVCLLPNAAQSLFAARRGPRNIILKARQLGMTTWITARIFLKTLLGAGTVSMLVAHRMESAQQIFEIARRFLRHLPPSWQRAARTARGSLREIAFGHNDSRFLVETAGSPDAARGLTIHNLHASEAASWPGEPRETMAALLASLAPGGSLDLESTPRGAGGFFHSEWMCATQRGTSGAGALEPHFFPWWIEPEYALPLARGETLEPLLEEEKQLAAAGLAPEKIKYRRWLRLAFGGLAAQEYAENATDCFLLSGRLVFEAAAIEARIRALAKGNRPAEERHNGALRVWLEPQAGRSYVIGADVAEGTEEGDYSAAVALDSETGLECAELCVRWPVGRFAGELAELARRYNDALIAVERNNHGHAVLFALAERPGVRLYSHPEDGRLGWPMNVRTKPQAVMALGRVLRESPGLILSARLLEQCRGYSYGADGEMGALPGMHDDLVIAAAIAHAVRAGCGEIRLSAAAMGIAK